MNKPKNIRKAKEEESSYEFGDMKVIIIKQGEEVYNQLLLDLKIDIDHMPKIMKNDAMLTGRGLVINDIVGIYRSKLMIENKPIYYNVYYRVVS